MVANRRESAVSFYPTEHPALNLTVKSRLMQTLREGEQDLGMGLSSDWADYKYRCGVMHGLRLAISLCDEVLKEMGER